MRTGFHYACTIALFIALGLSTAGCPKQARVADPLGNVTLVPPYPVDYPGAPSDRISVQYAVIAVAKQVGVDYDWDTSFKSTDPVCRQWITPVIQNRPFPQALDMILGPVNLSYTIVNGKIILGPRL
jgi:hypothetical protein